jgi:hypothetical protein
MQSSGFIVMMSLQDGALLDIASAAGAWRVLTTAAAVSLYDRPVCACVQAVAVLTRRLPSIKPELPTSAPAWAR